MKLSDLEKKKVLILGFGREGEDTFKFLRKLFPKKTIGVADIKPNIRQNIRNVRWHLGGNYLKAVKNYDIIIKSPGIPFKIIGRSNLPRLMTQTEIFFDNCQGIIVGVTGTKGKSTTASLIYQILKQGGIKAHLVGNIGKPVLRLLEVRPPTNKVYVYELSSHQLYSLKKSPHIAVLLNVYQEHLDYYRSFKEYANAKANITRYQAKNDYLVYNAGDRIVREIAKKSRAKKIPIKGEYYFLDKAAAKAVGKIFKVPSKIIDKAIKKFRPLPHRLELVGTFKGITFYNDALATIPEATIRALDTLGSRVETIMLGGYERKIDFKNLAKRVLKSKIKNVILFPTTGKRIWQEILKQGQGRTLTGLKVKKRGMRHFFVDNMEKAVKIAYDNTRKGKICLLSTASPSFSIFKDYKEKGNLFKKYVKKHGR